VTLKGGTRGDQLIWRMISIEEEEEEEEEEDFA